MNPLKTISTWGNENLLSVIDAATKPHRKHERSSRGQMHSNRQKPYKTRIRAKIAHRSRLANMRLS